jgi:hypothetical protein
VLRQRTHVQWNSSSCLVTSVSSTFFSTL